MMEWGDGGWMQAGFDIVRSKRNYLQCRKIFFHASSYKKRLQSDICLKKSYTCMHMDLVFAKWFQGYFSDIFPITRPGHRRGNVGYKQESKELPHRLLVRECGIFESGTAFEYFTRQVKETCVLNHRTGSHGSALP